MLILHAARIREAAAVLKNGKPVLIVYAPQLSAEQISERLIPLMKTLPRGHQITEIIMRDTPLPRTATGKIRRWELQKETAERQRDELEEQRDKLIEATMHNQQNKEQDDEMLYDDEKADFRQQNEFIQKFNSLYR